jgi:hypothetical protein
MLYTSTGRTTIVIPVPANEIVRADQNTTNASYPDDMPPGGGNPAADHPPPPGLRRMPAGSCFRY